ncbi:Transposable element P transposase [Aphis craccivora]|uniref:Transposable element P transposase n=1 Tax=Aphis craccivora TaxID=307492 RepID=A0A6G0Y4I6_APHCR|nr:Transposable element P transposase [Aphis craccivora]
MYKITPTHSQKKTCKLAIQLFSHSVSAAIRTCITTGELKSPIDIDTANFINIMNNMFDSDNSKFLYDSNPNKRPISDRNPQVFKYLEKTRHV